MIKWMHGYYSLYPDTRVNKLSVDRMTGEIMSEITIDSMDYIPSSECFRIFYDGYEDDHTKYSYFYIEDINDTNNRFSVSALVWYGDTLITLYELCTRIKNICEPHYLNGVKK